MFDWDRDYTELVEGRVSSTEQADAETAEDHSAQDASAEDTIPSTSALRRYFVSIALGAVILAGVAFEKADAVQIFNKSTVPVDLFGPVVEQVVADPLPQGLLIYEAAEYRRFMAGLQGLDAAELVRLAQSAHADLQHAPPSMQPFFRDALFLIERTINRREG